MRSNRKRTITNTIFYAFGVLLLLFLLYAFWNYRAIEGISILARTIHNHPLVVSNASLQANSNILKIHSNMKDLVMLRDEQLIEEKIETNKVLEQATISHLKTVQHNILGQKGQEIASDALVMFFDWRPTRDRVIANVRDGDLDTAAKITWEEGGAEVDKLEAKMAELQKYARTKATGFLGDSESVYNDTIHRTLFILPFWMVVFFGVAFIAIRKTYQVERSLSEEKEKLNVTLRSIGDGVIATDKNGKIILLNEVAEELTGWAESEAMGKKISTVFNIINEITRLPCENPVTKVLESNGIVGLANHTVLISKDGTEKAIADSGAPIRNEDDQITGVVLVFRDQTEEKEYQDKILQSERKYRMLSENTLDAIWTTNLDYQFSYINRAVISFFGFSQEEWVGSCIADHCDEKNLGIITSSLERLLSQNVDGAGTLFEMKINHKSGEKIHVEIRSRVIFDKNGNPVGFQGVTRDISERKIAERNQANLEKQLIQAQKMESIGRLAGGVAHDFNNMLSVISGYTDFALGELEEGSKIHDDLKEVQNAAQRSTEITRQLLAFARKQTIAPIVLDINGHIERSLKMLNRLIGEDIDLSWMPTEKPYLVMMDPTQLDQILANLCVNSRDAISNVGQIVIETGRRTFDPEYCRNHPGSIAGDYSYIIVSDNGCGMDKTVQENAFEPFFTTKELGKGTGLGLATVYGIVKQNKGFVNIYSEKGKGTAVRVYIPKNESDDPSERASAKIESPLGQGETILLVEDEYAILKLTKRMLVELGYTVLDATSPRKAIQLVDQYAGTIDMILTDVVLPEMNGKELAEIIREKQQNAKLLYMSGYTSNVIVHRGVLEKTTCFIPKPFNISDLAKAVRKALDES